MGSLKQEAAITPAEEASPKLIQWFPNPGKMPVQTAGWRQDYLRYLNDWFYRGLSAESHPSLNGFGKRAGFLFAPSPEDRRRVLDKSRSDDVFTTITLVVALLSELEIEFRFGLSDRLKYVWGIIQEYWGERRISTPADTARRFDERRGALFSGTVCGGIGRVRPTSPHQSDVFGLRLTIFGIA